MQYWKLKISLSESISYANVYERKYTYIPAIQMKGQKFTHLPLHWLFWSMDLDFSNQDWKSSCVAESANSKWWLSEDTQVSNSCHANSLMFLYIIILNCYLGQLLHRWYWYMVILIHTASQAATWHCNWATLIIQLSTKPRRAI